ncbi:MAG: adenine deaminase, partial [Saprospiraceae bacterium]|nr:adenine deaminase [Saprospiraceae bacterium]
SEMMNYPGVLFGDEEVHRKLEIAKKSGKPIDGHAPGLRGDPARKYIEAGITTDHECFTLEEALDKLKYGMKILIREGSAAKNFEALHPLIKSHPDMLMLCSDDKHPDDLLEGHINQLVKRAIGLGYDLFDVLRMACIHPVDHYNMDVGLLREGDKADLILVDDLVNFQVKKTFIEGQLVAEEGKSFLDEKTHSTPNQFNIGEVSAEAFQIHSDDPSVEMILALDGQLITERATKTVAQKNGMLIPLPKEDILKISVINRYFEAPIASGFISGIGLTEGAIASTVAHDSHNIVVVGIDDESMARAANLLIREKGGLSAVNQKEERSIGLPVAGLMSDQACEIIGKAYGEIDAFAKEMGSTLTAPFMTLSFMALLVIPKIKMSDKGLFDAEKFEFIK